MGPIKVAAVLLLLSACASAPKMPSGRALLSPEPLPAFRLVGDGNKASLSVIDVSGPGFAKALSVRTIQQPENPWELQVLVSTAGPVRKGDVLLAVFHMRCVESRNESGEGSTELVFERGSAPWDKSVSYGAVAGREWRHFHVPFKAQDDLGAGEAILTFRAGYPPQTIQIGGIELLNLGPDADMASLPRTKIEYRGMEANASWRRLAHARIQEIRKAPIKVKVVDGSGNPVKGARVRIEMKRHAFHFGSAVAARSLVRLDTPDGARYREELIRNFNMATPGNDLKWRVWSGDWGKSNAPEVSVAGVDWLNENGFDVRGHVLVWPGWNYLPRNLRDIADKPDLLRETVLAHIREVAGAVRGKLIHWDVINEPFDNHALMDILGNEAMVDWFQEARKSDPRPRLYLNDYTIISGGGGPSRHRDHFEETLRFLLEKGAPLGGIGIQGHFGSAVTAPEDVLAILDRYAAFGLPMLVTEYDHNVEDEGLQAIYLRDILTVLFSHPAVDGFVMWGFWDGEHWRKNAPLFRKDWSLKPSGEIYRELVYGKWWTRETGKAGRRGEYSLNGFLGDYEITAESGGRKASASAKLTAAGLEIEIVL